MGGMSARGQSGFQGHSAGQSARLTSERRRPWSGGAALTSATATASSVVQKDGCRISLQPKLFSFESL